MAIRMNSVDALALWRNTLEIMVKDKDNYDLSTRQMVIMLDVYFSETPFTVRGLSSYLSISKPAITRALNHLGRLGLIKRKTDPEDKRSVLIQRTVKGSVFLSEFADTVVKCANHV